MVGSGENQNLVHTVLKCFHHYTCLLTQSTNQHWTIMDFKCNSIQLYIQSFKKNPFQKTFLCILKHFSFFSFLHKKHCYLYIGYVLCSDSNIQLLSIKLGGWVTISIWEAKGDDAGNACWCISNISLYFIVRFPILLETFQLKIQSFWTVNYVLHFSVIFSVFTVEKA